jgi:hypothetical protein
MSGSEIVKCVGIGAISMLLNYLVFGKLLQKREVEN